MNSDQQLFQTARRLAATDQPQQEIDRRIIALHNATRTVAKPPAAQIRRMVDALNSFRQHD